jgi:nucleolin
MAKKIKEEENEDVADEEQKQQQPTEDAEEDDDAPAAGKRKRKRKRKNKTAEEVTTNEIKNTPSTLLRDQVDHTVYVEGIPFDANADQVKEFFVSHGIIDVLELRLPTWQDSGRLRGYGHVAFESEESKVKAVSLSGEFLQKRYLKIEPAKAPKAPNTQRFDNDPFAPPPKDCKTIYVHNLPYQATEEDISKVFETFGTIVDGGVRIARNSVSRQSKGFAYVDYAAPEEAQKAVQSCASTHAHVGGRLVRVDYDTGRMKGSFKTGTGRLWTQEQKESKKSRKE